MDEHGLIRHALTGTNNNNTLLIELRKAGLKAEDEKKITVCYEKRTAIARFSGLMGASEVGPRRTSLAEKSIRAIRETRAKEAKRYPAWMTL